MSCSNDTSNEDAGSKPINQPSTKIKDRFFFGDSSKNVPKWAKYKTGNKIMESFIEENPNVSIANWTDMRADEILMKSKYEGR
ncbi:DUF2268 domain-containing putative Zn-dependent protease [Virgibacillus necropolis]|nr:DUF2268 domain-containing putative Zn-dependent protease [Virgibacillus necropolis]